MIRLKHLLPAAILAVSAIAVRADTLSDGRRIAEAFLDGETAPLWEAATPDLRQAIGSEDAVRDLRRDLGAGFGTEAEVLSETVASFSGLDVYTRLSRWTDATPPVEILVSLDTEGRVAGFFVRQQPAPAPSEQLDYDTRADLRLPFDGDWTVIWGGRTVTENYHAVDPGQRFALDLAVEIDGARFAGDPADQANYHCWGRPILAPADGTVVRAVNDLPDQAIGATDRANPAGNHVVIDFGEGEFGFLAHMQEGSVGVVEGEAVTRGQQIGVCGNSGNTSEPHLHFHLQTTPDLGTGVGLPAQFEAYTADGMPVPRGEPVRGETVAQAD
ncbi:peptidoglycan DD-metalloendopeptidase family protein [Rhodobacterales bacterium HKCCE2091]|nr:peptidoglycan DD-metalloendopeptidase family protein [Rhodobacterales bacterium HKCCE2091]